MYHRRRPNLHQPGRQATRCPTRLRRGEAPFNLMIRALQEPDAKTCAAFRRPALLAAPLASAASVDVCSL